MDRYAEVADWDLSTRKAHEFYIRRVIKPALGHLQVCKIRGPLLDLLYAQLRRCGDPGCTGKRFIEHRNVPTLDVNPASRRPAWQQVANVLRDAIMCALQVCDADLENGVLHLAYNYVVVGGRRARRDTKTHQDRYLAIDPVTCAMLREHLDAIRAELGGLGLKLPEDAYMFSNDPISYVLQ